MDQNTSDFLVVAIVFALGLFAFIGLVELEERRFKRHADQALALTRKENRS